jgi:hypothetical protein
VGGRYTKERAGDQTAAFGNVCGIEVCRRNSLLRPLSLLRACTYLAHTGVGWGGECTPTHTYIHIHTYMQYKRIKK